MDGTDDFDDLGDEELLMAISSAAGVFFLQGYAGLL